MRTIEEKIIGTIQENRNNVSITEKIVRLSCRDAVRFEKIGHYVVSFVMLWDSEIFIKTNENCLFSFCGYNTITTKSRINALLSYYTNNTCYVKQKNYILYFCNGKNEIEINDTKRYKISYDENNEIILKDFSDW